MKVRLTAPFKREELELMVASVFIKDCMIKISDYYEVAISDVFKELKRLHIENIRYLEKTGEMVITNDEVEIINDFFGNEELNRYAMQEVVDLRRIVDKYDKFYEYMCSDFLSYLKTKCICSESALQEIRDEIKSKIKQLEKTSREYYYDIS